MCCVAMDTLILSQQESKYLIVNARLKFLWKCDFEKRKGEKETAVGGVKAMFVENHIFNMTQR